MSSSTLNECDIDLEKILQMGYLIRARMSGTDRCGMNLYRCGKFTKRYRLIAVGCLIALSLIGCASTAVQPTSEITFRQSDFFDASVGSALKAGLPEVKIGFATNERFDNLPPNLDGWLHAIEQSGGRIEVVQQRQEQFLLGAMAGPIVQVLFGRLLSSAQSISKFTVANGYDARVFLNGSNLHEVVFVKRADQ
jgi:hypothetical protein